MKRTFFYCVASALVGGVLSLVLTSPWAPNSEVAAQAPVYAPGNPVPVAPDMGMNAPMPGGVPVADDLTPEERVNVAVYENCNRSVVNITTKGYHGDRILFVEIPSEGEGSGVVIDRQGRILTNFHVLDGAQQIEVTLYNNKTYDARPVGVDPATDVAVIKIEAPAEELFPVPFGDSSRLRVGQRVYAIGNPFGLERTLSTGIISSLDRWLPSRRNARKIKQIIQIDASINPGNSGGPLLDSHGRMIGMNTAIASKTGESAGVGFAIPINTIARIVPQLVERGKVIRPESGIARVAQTEHGLLIATVVPGGPAERAGLHGPKVVRQRKRQGPFVYEYQTVDKSTADLIVAVDGQPTKTADDFLNVVESKRPGDTVTVAVVRNGREISVPLRLDAGE